MVSAQLLVCGAAFASASARTAIVWANLSAQQRLGDRGVVAGRTAIERCE